MGGLRLCGCHLSVCICILVCMYVGGSFGESRGKQPNLVFQFVMANGEMSEMSENKIHNIVSENSRNLIIDQLKNFQSSTTLKLSKTSNLIKL